MKKGKGEKYTEKEHGRSNSIPTNCRLRLGERKKKLGTEKRKKNRDLKLTKKKKNRRRRKIILKAESIIEKKVNERLEGTAKVQERPKESHKVLRLRVGRRTEARKLSPGQYGKKGGRRCATLTKKTREKTWPAIQRVQEGNNGEN